MSETWLKVGELARNTGLTVRTLHHWDELGLLQPGDRTDAGHRLYGEEQVVRLQHIVTLRTLGFALEEFDAVGAWRDTDETGGPVDNVGTWPSGVELNGVASLRALLLDYDDQFVRTVTLK